MPPWPVRWPHNHTNTGYTYRHAGHTSPPVLTIASTCEPLGCWPYTPFPLYQVRVGRWAAGGWAGIDDGMHIRGPDHHGGMPRDQVKVKVMVEVEVKSQG